MANVKLFMELVILALRATNATLHQVSEREPVPMEFALVSVKEVIVLLPPPQPPKSPFVILVCTALLVLVRPFSEAVLLVPLSLWVEFLAQLVNGVLVTPENARGLEVLAPMELSMPPADRLIPICAKAVMPPT